MSAIREFFGLESRSEIDLDRQTKWSDWLDWKYDGIDPGDGTGPMTIERAHAIPAFFCGVRAISQTIASFPCEVVIDKDGETTEAKDEPVYRILKHEPNNENTKMEAMEAQLMNYVGSGNGFVYIDWNDRGVLRGYYPLSNDRVRVLRDRDDQLIYEVQSTAARGTWERIPYLTGKIGHLRGPGNGTVGFSPIEMFAMALGLNIQQYRFRANLLANGAAPRGMVTTPQGVNIDEKKLEKRQKDWEKMMSGGANAGKTAFLPGGWTYSQVSLSPVDLMLIEDLKLSGEDIARILGIPPAELFFQDKLTYNNAEQQARDFVNKTVRPHVTRVEQAYERDFLTLRQRRAGYRVKFNMDAFQRGDSESQARVIEIMVRNGILTINEARKLYDRNGVEGGDKNLVQGQMADVKTGEMFANTGEGGTEGVADKQDTAKAKQNARRALAKRVREDRTTGAMEELLIAASMRMHQKARTELPTRLKRQETLKEAEKTAEKFFSEHERFCVDVLTPPMRAAYKALSSEDISEDELRSMVKDKVDRHITGLRGMLAASMAEGTARMGEEIGTYNLEQAAKMSARGFISTILEGEHDHAA